MLTAIVPTSAAALSETDVLPPGAIMQSMAAAPMSAGLTAPAAGTERVVITPELVCGDSGNHNYMKIFDEGENFDPENPLTPVTADKIGGGYAEWPSSIFIDLGREYLLTDIYFYDGPIGAKQVAAPTSRRTEPIQPRKF